MNLNEHTPPEVPALPETPASASPVDQLFSQMDRLVERVQQFDIRQTAILRLLEELVPDLIERRLQDPIFQQLLPIHARLNRFDECRDPTVVMDDIEGLLDFYHLSLIQPGPGTPFDARLHLPVDTISIPDEDRHRQVAAVLRPGLQRADRVVQPARVRLFVHRNPQPNNQES